MLLTALSLQLFRPRPTAIIRTGASNDQRKTLNAFDGLVAFVLKYGHCVVNETAPECMSAAESRGENRIVILHHGYTLTLRNPAPREARALPRSLPELTDVGITLYGHGLNLHGRQSQPGTTEYLRFDSGTLADVRHLYNQTFHQARRPAYSPAA